MSWSWRTTGHRRISFNFLSYFCVRRHVHERGENEWADVHVKAFDVWSRILIVPGMTPASINTTQHFHLTCTEKSAHRSRRNDTHTPARALTCTFNYTYSCVHTEVNTHQSLIAVPWYERERSGDWTSTPSWPPLVSWALTHTHTYWFPQYMWELYRDIMEKKCSSWISIFHSPYQVTSTNLNTLPLVPVSVTSLDCGAVLEECWADWLAVTDCVFPAPLSLYVLILICFQSIISVNPTLTPPTAALSYGPF